MLIFVTIVQKLDSITKELMRWFRTCKINSPLKLAFCADNLSIVASTSNFIDSSSIFILIKLQLYSIGEENRRI